MSIATDRVQARKYHTKAHRFLAVLFVLILSAFALLPPWWRIIPAMIYLPLTFAFTTKALRYTCDPQYLFPTRPIGFLALFTAVGIAVCGAGSIIRTIALPALLYYAGLRILSICTIYPEEVTPNDRQKLPCKAQSSRKNGDKPRRK